MKVLNKIFVLSTVLLVTISCDVNKISNDVEDSEQNGSILIRVENVSSVDFKSVYMKFPGTESSYENIPTGKKSSYQPFETAYRYASIEVTADNGVFKLQPIDYVGEKELEQGKYTYQLDVSSGSVDLKLIRD